MSDPAEAAFPEQTLVGVPEMDAIHAERSIVNAEYADHEAEARRGIDQANAQITEIRERVNFHRDEQDRKVRDINARLDEMAAQKLRGISQSPEDRNTDEAYQIYTSWMFDSSKAEERNMLLSGLSRLREQMEGVSAETPKIIVVHNDLATARHIIVAESLPFIGISENRKLSSGLVCGIKTKTAIDLTDERTGPRVARAEDEDAWLLNSLSQLDPGAVLSGKVAVAEMGAELEALSLAHVRKVLEGNYHIPSYLPEFAKRFAAREALGLANDPKLVQEVLRRLVRDDAAAKAVVELARVAGIELLPTVPSSPEL